MTGAAGWLGFVFQECAVAENCIAIQLLYCRQEKARLEILYCNTPLYCDMSSLAAGENCIAIQGLGCREIVFLDLKCIVTNSNTEQ